MDVTLHFLCINDHDDNSFCHTFACNKKPANAHVFWRTKLVQSSFGEPKFFELPWEYTFLINGAFQIIFCFNTQKTHISHIVDHVKKPANLYAFWRSRRRPDLHRICGRRPKKLSAALLLCIKYLKRGQDRVNLILNAGRSWLVLHVFILFFLMFMFKKVFFLIFVLFFYWS